MKKLLVGGVLLIYSLILFLSFFSEDKVYFELIISLTPYWITINLLLLGLILTKKLRTLKLLKFSILRLSFLMLLLVTSLMLHRFLTFNFTKTESSFLVKSAVAAENPINLKIAFLNKLYSNTNYLEIDNKIASLNPDLIGFSEFKAEDKNQIVTLSEYPYSFSVNSRDQATISFFSKYPAMLNQAAPNLEFVLPISVNIENQNYFVFIIHPLPPSTDGWVKQRNVEIFSLANYINTLPEDKVILLGDFNLTPWTKTYQNLVKSLTGLKDTARGQGPLTTWHAGLIKTQIDHIFVPNTSLVEKFNSEYIKGSDHNLIWTQIIL